MNEIMEVYDQEVNEKVGVTEPFYDQPQSGAAWHAVRMSRGSAGG